MKWLLLLVALAPLVAWGFGPEQDFSGGGPDESRGAKGGEKKEKKEKKPKKTKDDQSETFVAIEEREAMTNKGKKKAKKTKKSKKNKKTTYEANLDKIQAHNRQNGDFKMSTNWMSDLTQDEVDSTILMGGFVKNDNNKNKNRLLRRLLEEPEMDEHEKRRRLQSYPASLDHSDPVKVPTVQQGQCGSCYSYSTLQALKMQALKENPGKVIPSLSWNQGKSCTNSRPFGCDGGWPHVLANYGKTTGYVLDSQYTDNPITEQCDASKSPPTVPFSFKVGTVETVIGEVAIMEKLQNGPMTVCVHFDSTLASYGGGIYSGSCSTTAINHAVVLTGYGEENGQPYWKLQNSWGPNWGEGGFFRLKRGTTTTRTGGPCGMNGIYSGMYSAPYCDPLSMTDIELPTCTVTWSKWSDCPSGCGQQKSRSSSSDQVGCSDQVETEACGSPCSECIEVTGSANYWVNGYYEKTGTSTQDFCGNNSPVFTSYITPHLNVHFYASVCDGIIGGEWTVSDDHGSYEVSATTQNQDVSAAQFPNGAVIKNLASCPPKPTCAGACESGIDNTGSCYCDCWCIGMGDCCEDKIAQCGAGTCDA